MINTNNPIKMRYSRFSHRPTNSNMEENLIFASCSGSRFAYKLESGLEEENYVDQSLKWEIDRYYRNTLNYQKF